MTEDANRAAWLQQARSYLRDADPVLARLVDDRAAFDPRAWMAQLPPMDLYGALLFQVTGQQLSVAATRRTLARIEALSTAISLTRRAAGSRSRQAPRGRALVAEDQHTPRPRRAAVGRPAEPERLEQPARRRAHGGAHRNSRDRSLDRAGCPHHRAPPRDVVLPGDLALRKAVQAAYRLDHLPTQQEVLAIAEKWRPYRSLATSYLFSAAFEPPQRLLPRLRRDAIPGVSARSISLGAAGSVPLMPPPGGLPSATRSCRCQAVHVLSAARNHHDPAMTSHLVGGEPGPVAKIRTAEWRTTNDYGNHRRREHRRRAVAASGPRR